MFWLIWPQTFMKRNVRELEVISALRNAWHSETSKKQKSQKDFSFLIFLQGFQGFGDTRTSANDSLHDLTLDAPIITSLRPLVLILTMNFCKGNALVMI